MSYAWCIVYRRTNGAITELDVPAAARRVTLTYEPAAFHRGLALAGLGVILLGIVTTCSGPGTRPMIGKAAE